MQGEAGNALKGVQNAQKAIALDPDNPDYHMVAHDLYAQLGLQREAAKSLQLILHALRVENPRGLQEYAGILVEMSHVDSAITVLEAGVPVWEAALASKNEQALLDGRDLAVKEGVAFTTLPAADQQRFDNLYLTIAERNAASLTRYGIDGNSVFAMARQSVRADGSVSCPGDNP